MSTERQRAANQQNAQKSTGPTTPEGRAKSALNHLSHGFCSSAVVMDGEDPEEFKALLDGFTLEYAPQTQTEQILVEQLAINQWLSLRAFRLQGFAFLNDKLRTGAPFSVPKDLGLLIRYKTSADNAFRKAHSDLVKAQKERKKSEIGFDPQSASGASSNSPQKVQKIIEITWVGDDSPASAAQPPDQTAAEPLPAVKTAV